MRSGKISVQTENIFPIIKKFLYSEQEIFLRELVSNAVDATTKLQALASKGTFKGETGPLTIEVIVNKDAGTLTIRDRGIGMDEEEVDKYLNQLAFSSAEEFIRKHKGDISIIGHFGLGFYSAFMVADKVEVLTRSYKKGKRAVRWSCQGDTEFSIDDAEKEDRGTDVILHLSEDCREYLEEGKIRSLLERYCRFLPFPIQFGTRKVSEKVGEEDREGEEPDIVNNTHPLWKKAPSDISDDDYKAFYSELYPYGEDPLFWIHLNIDYPFNLTGILYFPKIRNNIEVQKNRIHLYCNQVFVTDDVKEIVPEYLMLLHGVIDSPDIPLNVSRSYLQADANVRKISGYITRKVAEKLGELFKKDRKDFERKWNDIATFIKYGLISDEKFWEKAHATALLQNADLEYFTLEEYREKISTQQKDKNGKLIALYTHDPKAHYSYLAAARDYGYDVLLLNNVLDNHFIQTLEMKADMQFKRIDSDAIPHLIEREDSAETVLSETERKTVEGLFSALPNNKAAKTVVKALAPDAAPVVIVKPEFMRRMSEMQYMMQGPGTDGEDNPFLNHYECVINGNHPVIAQKLLATGEGEMQNALADYLFQLAMLDQQMLRGEALHAFVKSSLQRLNG